MANDFFIQAAQQRAAEIDADIAEINAGLARAKAEGDDYNARTLIQGLATARAQRRDLEAEFNSYVASQQPRQEGPTSDAEFLAKSPERMTGEDVDRVMSKSKYYSPDMWSDPAVAARVNAGVAEVQRRRRSGQ